MKKAKQQLLRSVCKTLKMPGLARAAEQLTRQAEEEGWALEDYLYELLHTELISRDESAVRNRIRAAKFPDVKTLDDFDFKAAEGLSARTFTTLAAGDYIDAAQNVVMLGPIGTGKTHLAIALGMEAAKQKRHVVFYRAADLVQQLIEARDERALGRVQRRLDRAKLLVIDELGFVPFERHGGELLFNLIARRYEKRSIVVTTNLSFGEWPKVFAGDEKLTTALLDRLADRAHIITTKGKSYRMRRRKAATV